MNEHEAKKLKVGDRVRFQDSLPSEDNGSLGTVAARDYARFLVHWDDGVECSYPHILAMAIHKEADVKSKSTRVWSKTRQTFIKQEEQT